MSSVLRSPVPIASTAELSVWWAEVLAEPDAPDRALSLLWLDCSGHRLGRVLSISGVSARPDRRVIGLIRQLREAVAEDSGDPVHLALALTRSGPSSVIRSDRDWAAALGSTLDAGDEATWSLHVATPLWITTVVEPPADKFDPHRVARRPPRELLSRDWLIDQDSRS